MLYVIVSPFEKGGGKESSAKHNLLADIAETIAVRGNMDEGDLRRSLSESIFFERDGVRFGVYHGRGPAKRVLDFAVEDFKDEKVDVVVFGSDQDLVSLFSCFVVDTRSQIEAFDGLWCLALLKQ